MNKKPKKKKRPEKVKIGYKEYSIVYSDQLTDYVQIYEPSVQGKILINDALIHIFNHSYENDTKNTLLHEIIHGICNMEAIDMEERDVINLTNCLLLFLKENPTALNYIVED